MLPIRSANPTSSTAYVTIGLIVVNCLIFLMQELGPVDAARFSVKYGFVPAELVSSKSDFSKEFEAEKLAALERQQIVDRFGRPLFKANGEPLLVKDAPELLREKFIAPHRQEITADVQAAVALPAWLNIFTCMFLHGGWMHLIGNMLFLWIFGNSIEDKLGPWLFIVFFLGTGVCGSLAHTFFDPGYVPLVGASGAISGVMGAYVLLFPRTRILAIVPIGWYPATFSLPAWVYLGFYILLQNLWPAFRGGENSAVAYWAHIGGFIAGMALIYVFPHRKHASPPTPAYDPDEDDADFVL